MTKNERSPLERASNTNLENELTMKNIPHNNLEFQLKLPDIPTRATNLSRLPKLADRPKFELPSKGAACAGCGGRLDRDDNFQQSVKVCRKCLAHYAKIDTAIDEASKRKRRQLLEKFAAEVS